MELADGVKGDGLIGYKRGGITALSREGLLGRPCEFYEEIRGLVQSSPRLTVWSGTGREKVVSIRGTVRRRRAGADGFVATTLNR